MAVSRRFFVSSQVSDWAGQTPSADIRIPGKQYSTPVLNSYESIATVTVGAGGTSTITFSSIPTGYTHLQIRGIAQIGRAHV